MLSASGLTYRIDSHRVVSNAVLDVAPGALVALSGPSGCGKSTLLRLLCGLLERDSGTITLDFVPLPPLRDVNARRAWHRRVLLLPQDTSRAFNPVRPLRQQFTDALALHRLGRNDAERYLIATTSLSEVGLSADILDRYAEQLSGGQRQRAALARLLCLRPDILLLDEPSSALDPATALETLDLINHLRRSNNLGVLMATHDWRLAAFADSGITMRSGVLSHGSSPS